MVMSVVMSVAFVGNPCSWIYIPTYIELLEAIVKFFFKISWKRSYQRTFVPHEPEKNLTLPMNFDLYN